MFKFVEAVFTAFTAIYNTDNNTIIYNGQTYTYEDFDEEFFIHVIETPDEYNFRKDLEDQLYRNYLYDQSYIEYYDPTPELYV